MMVVVVHVAMYMCKRRGVGDAWLLAGATITGILLYGMRCRYVLVG